MNRVYDQENFFISDWHLYGTTVVIRINAIVHAAHGLLV